MTNFQLYIALMAAACGLWWVGGKVVEITHRDGSTSVHGARVRRGFLDAGEGQVPLILLLDGRVFMHPTACTWREL